MRFLHKNQYFGFNLSLLLRIEARRSGRGPFEKHTREKYTVVKLCYEIKYFVYIRARPGKFALLD